MPARLPTVQERARRSLRAREPVQHPSCPQLIAGRLSPSPAPARAVPFKPLVMHANRCARPSRTNATRRPKRRIPWTLRDRRSGPKSRGFQR